MDRYVLDFEIDIGVCFIVKWSFLYIDYKIFDFFMVVIFWVNVDLCFGVCINVLGVFDVVNVIYVLNFVGLGLIYFD